jgi:hypothetical protein
VTLRREGSGTIGAGIRSRRAHPSFLPEEAGVLLATNGVRTVRRGAARRTAKNLWCAAIAACAPGGDAAEAAARGPVSVIDDAGRTVALPEPARRVISMVPAQTEIVTILAGVDAVIARTQWDHDPRLAHLPSIGNALTPSVEWLAAQRPDLVIVWPDAQSRDVVSRLSGIGVPVYASRVESVAEIRSMIERLGVLLGAEAWRAPTRHRRPARARPRLPRRTSARRSRGTSPSSRSAFSAPRRRGRRHSGRESCSAKWPWRPHVRH